jgi:hypothetical protein
MRIPARGAIILTAVLLQTANAQPPSIVPMERWVAGASPEALASYTRSAPICLGDCYWLEALVHAIEASGRTEWLEVQP